MKRNYGTVQREIKVLIDDLTSKGRDGAYHNLVNPKELLPLIEAITQRLPKLNGDYMMQLLYMVCGAQTVATMERIEIELDNPERFHSAFLDFMKNSRRYLKKKEENDGTEK